MPHCRCVACQVRLRVSGSTAEPGGDLCPECGSLLEPVAALAELVGYRSVKSPDSAAADDAERSGARQQIAERSGARQQIADRVDEFVTRRTAILELDRLEPERWLDDSDGPIAAAVALPPPETYS
jgi:hypothetical protein